VLVNAGDEWRAGRGFEGYARSLLEQRTQSIELESGLSGWLFSHGGIPYLALDFFRFLDEREQPLGADSQVDRSFDILRLFGFLDARLEKCDFRPRPV